MWQARAGTTPLVPAQAPALPWTHSSPWWLVFIPASFFLYDLIQGSACFCRQFYWDIASPVCFHIIYSYQRATVERLSNFNRKCMDYKPYDLAFKKKADVVHVFSVVIDGDAEVQRKGVEEFPSWRSG